MPQAPVDTLTVRDAGERALIERIRAQVPASPEWVQVGIGDDAAVLVPARNDLDVLTTDALVEGVHFDRAFVPARAIGYRGLAANLSDLAAMGARPRAALLSLGLPDTLAVADLDAMVAGLLTLASAYDVPLVGGNIARSPSALFVDITLVGTARPRRIMRRSGARPGDVLYVSGQIGGAAAGLEWCRQNGLEAAAAIGNSRAPLAAGLRDHDSGEAEAGRDDMHRAAARFLYPDPRVRLGSVLAASRAARACVDLSDGLADAVHQMASASGVGAIVEGARLPIDGGVRKWFEEAGRDPVVSALRGGEDYELLFAWPPRRDRLLPGSVLNANECILEYGLIESGSDG